MLLWTIYDHPDDYPEHYVVREWAASPDGVTSHGAVTFDTLEDARAAIRKRGPLMMCMERDPSADPKIVETWL